MIPTPRLLAATIVITLASAVVYADTVESTSGIVVQGKVISRDSSFVVLEVQVGGKPVQRKYAIGQIRAITVDGMREVLQEPAPKTSPSSPAPKTPGAVSPAADTSSQQVEALIAEAGKTPPDWLTSTPLVYPKTLDLSWPQNPGGPWSNQKNVGQYIWDVINPNPGRWREGIKLVQHLMDTHANDSAYRARAAGAMGSMYHNLFQDYARAAYWWRQAPGRHDPVALAECYWRLGSKPMAVAQLNNFDAYVASIKLWGDMGELDRALALADDFADSHLAALAYMNAGDACRLAGNFPKALEYYREVLSIAPSNPKDKRTLNRAKASIDAIQLFDALDLAKVRDGTYSAASLGYEADIVVAVTVRAGRIEDVKVTKHREKQFYSALIDTPRQIIAKQSVNGVDATSHATLTSEAITNATAKALYSGMK